MPVNGIPASAVSNAVSLGGNPRGGGPMKQLLLLELPGEPSIMWNFRVATFCDHLLAYDLDNIAEARKLAILCSSLGGGLLHLRGFMSKS